MCPNPALFLCEAVVREELGHATMSQPRRDVTATPRCHGHGGSRRRALLEPQRIQHPTELPPERPGSGQGTPGRAETVILQTAWLSGALSKESRGGSSPRGHRDGRRQLSPVS